MLGSGYSVVIKIDSSALSIYAIIVELPVWEHLGGWIIVTKAETSVSWDQRGRQDSGKHERVVTVKSLDFIPTVTISHWRLTAGESHFSFIKITLSSSEKWLLGRRGEAEFML